MIKKILKNKIYALALFLLVTPSIVSAHVKWFVEGGTTSTYTTNEPSSYYFMIWTIIGITLISIGILLEKKLPEQSKEKQYKLNSKKPKAASIFSMFIGLFFILASFNGFLFSENLNNLGNLSSTLLISELVIGVALLLGIAVRFFSVGLLILWFVSFFYLGVINTLEALWVFATSIFLIIYGRSNFSPFKKLDTANKKFLKYQEYAFPILRILIGLNLALLGFTEKLLRPELGMAFLEKFQWNFMQNILGIDWYSNYLFVISAGFTEVLIGVIFILGIVTRINALITITLFTIPLFFMGLVELIGHLPHLAIVLMLLIFGSQNKFKLFKKEQKQNSY